MNEQEQQQNYDFVAIGDIVTDAFIELEDAWIENDNPEKNQELCMSFGDKLPYRQVDALKAVGNSPNAAVSAHRLGLRAALVSDIGDDQNGDDIIAKMDEEGVTTQYVRVHAGRKSNYHYVLRYKADRTILVKHEQYDYTLPENLPAPQWIYLSSLADNSLPYHEIILSYLEAHPDVKLAFQPGTFQMELGIEKLANIYKRSNAFFCNVEEARRILSRPDGEVKELLQAIHELGPDIVCITDGPDGAYAFNGEKSYFMPTYPDPKEPVERTGAGDAFSSTFTSALALGKSFEEALTLAPINPMNVVQHIGAQEGLLSIEKVMEYYEKRPESYKPQEI